MTESTDNPTVCAPRPAPRRRARRWVGGLLTLTLVAAGAAAYRLDLVVPWYDHFFAAPAAPPPGPAEVAPPAGLELPPVPDVEAVAQPLPEPGAVSARKVEAAIAPFLADPNLGPRVLAAVDDLTTGRSLARVGSGTAIPASTTKLLTSLAALSALGPERTFQTRVVAGGSGTIVLVGGGDPYLMAEPADQDPLRYPERADIATLAALTAQALRDQGRKRVSVGYDDSLFDGPRFNPAWPPSYAAEHVVSPITALWVDQGRVPGSFRRVEDPSASAAQAFADALVAHGIKVQGAPARGVASGAGAELASVSSAPVREIVARVLEVSDNEAAEVLAHHVGLEVRGRGSFSAGTKGIVETLRGLGVETDGIEIYDGSGLSRENRISPEALLSVLRVAATGDGDLRTVIESLPVSGFTGSLTNRFDDAFPQSRGLVRAKTGTLTAVSSLAGIAIDQRGHALLFVLMADRIAKPDEDRAQVALDKAAGALAACRCGPRPRLTP